MTMHDTTPTPRAQPRTDAAVVPHPTLQRIALRAKLDRAADQLTDTLARVISMLDAIDADPDLEDDERETDDDHEPALGSTGGIDQRSWGEDFFSFRGPTDLAPMRRPACDLELDTADAEPCLGRSENADQTKSEGGSVHDEEWSLGAANPSGRLDQTHWGDRQDSWPVGGDAEEQCEDEGGACEDEGADTGDDEPDGGGRVPNYEGHHSQLRPGVWGAY